jgi:hypothetical protein
LTLSGLACNLSGKIIGTTAFSIMTLSIIDLFVTFSIMTFWIMNLFVTLRISHGQTLASRTNPGPSFQLKIWACANNMQFLHNNKTAWLKVENSAQTTFRFSPVSFRAPRISIKRRYAERHYSEFHYAECHIFLLLCWVSLCWMSLC